MDDLLDHQVCVVIAGIDQPTAGTVVVNGTDLTPLDEQARTRNRRAQAT